MLDLEEVKRQLEKRLHALENRVEEIEDGLRAPHSADWEEQAMERASDEMLDSLEDSSLAEISEIQTALKMIEDGSYGECLTCGEKISEKRLEVLPYATQCIDCAQ